MIGEDKKIKEQTERQWYAVHTYSGYEDAVARYLKQRVESMALNDKIFNVVVPKETKIKIKGGNRQKTEEKIYPGYVLVEMLLDNESWYVVRNTPRVTGFVGADSTTPTPLSREEVDELMRKMNQDEPRHKVDFKLGETVRITDGSFQDKEGKVIEINEDQGKVKVLVPLFGRDVTVELDLLQVRKI